jgi:hypothetical protein
MQPEVMMVSLSAVCEMVKGGRCTPGRFQLQQHIISSRGSAVTFSECAAKEPVSHRDVVVACPFARHLPCKMVLAQARHIFSGKLQQGWVGTPLHIIVTYMFFLSFKSMVMFKRVRKLQCTQNPGISLLA